MARCEVCGKEKVSYGHSGIFVEGGHGMVPAKLFSSEICACDSSAFENDSEEIKKEEKSNKES